MIVELMKEYRFEAAHRLPRVAPGHKCARVHGHSYKVEVFVTGPVDPQTGWLIDFGDMDDLWADKVHSVIDHRMLNDVPGLENSTCEVIAGWLWQVLKPALPALSALRVWETFDSSCTYRGT